MMGSDGRYRPVSRYSDTFQSIVSHVSYRPLEYRIALFADFFGRYDTYRLALIAHGCSNLRLAIYHRNFSLFAKKTTYIKSFLLSHVYKRLKGVRAEIVQLNLTNYFIQKI